MPVRFAASTLLLWFASLASQAVGAAEPLAFPNPLLPGADPHVTLSNGTYWAYPTWSWSGNEFYTFSSRNLKDWERHGPILRFADIPWIKDDGQARHFAWAPGVVKVGNKHYLYYSVGPQTATPARIGVAVGERPEGPFRDSGKPLVTGENGFEAIDPMVFVDPKNSAAYLYAGGSAGSTLRAYGLKPDMVTIAKQLPVETPPQFTEGAFLHHHAGLYHLTYSHGNYRDHTYSVHYATGKTPLGPWTYRGPILTSDAVRKGPGHHCLVQQPDGQWLVFYHCWYGAKGDGPYQGVRQICVDRITHGPDGLLRPVVMTGAPPK